MFHGVIPKDSRCRLNNLAITQHADFHRVNPDIGKHGFHLSRNKVSAHDPDPAYAPRILNSERRHRAAGIAAKRADRLDIGKKTRPSGRIHAGKTQNVGNDPSGCFFHILSRTVMVRSVAPV